MQKEETIEMWRLGWGDECVGRTGTMPWFGGGEKQELVVRVVKAGEPTVLEVLEVRRVG